MDKGLILVAEDERTARLALTDLLQDQGFSVLAADNGSDALSMVLSIEPAATLLDIQMPGLDGLSVLERAKESGSVTAFIVMTAYGDSTTAIEAMKRGAFDYIAKPLNFESLLPLLRSAVAHSLFLKQKHERPEAQSSPALVGNSPEMQRVYKMIGQVAGSDVNVLVRGESGTGKELVVNAIHHNSSRARGPLIKVNCAAIPEALLESELFGHERGAFTNATYRRTGRFEQANHGTLFLDEIGDLAPSLQSKLLRCVQERTITRLGSNTPIAVDIRLITATSLNLEQAVKEGRFREDLYYRLNVVSISLPSLRERRHDIPALVQHFVNRNGRQIILTTAALSALCEYPWPGNVRELENAIERAIVLARSGVIDAADLSLRSVQESAAVKWTDLLPLENGWRANLAAVEAALVRQALRHAEGNKSRAAEILGIQRRLLYEKIREHGLDAGKEMKGAG
jgi:DNA-binding NtrC family response regulator